MQMNLAVIQLKDPPPVSFALFYGPNKLLPHPSWSRRPQPDVNTKENISETSTLICSVIHLNPYLWSPSADPTARTFVTPLKKIVGVLSNCSFKYSRWEEKHTLLEPSGYVQGEKTFDTKPGSFILQLSAKEQHNQE